MTSTRLSRRATELALGLAALAFAATPASAQTIDLCASTGTATIGGAAVPIWGFVDTAGGPCTAGLATSLPGPVLEAAAGATLTINLTNALPVPVSMFIPGLTKNVADPLAPVVDVDGAGRERLASFDKTVPAGGTASYSWDASEGTYLYHSGADVRTQVPMGLYGALRVTGAGYPAVAQDEVLVFSEIDPALNANPAGFGGARASNWNPRYFLINGATYAPANPAIAVNIGEDVLLRFVNAGLETFVPTLDGGLYMDVIAEDGNLYPYPLTQYGIELTAGKTMDAIVNAGAEGSYALYDRALHLTNGMSLAGGMLTRLQAGAAAGVPVAVADAYSVAEDTVLAATVGGAIPGVLDNDLAGLGGAMTATLVSDVSSGVLLLAADGSFTYTPGLDFNGLDSFTYSASDSGVTSNVTTATITVTPVNDGGPTAMPDAYEVAEAQVLTVATPGLLVNDTDPDGDVLSVGAWTPASAGSLLVLSDGAFEFDASGLAAGTIATFSYEACDGDPTLCSTTTATITVVAAPNIAPIANDDTTSIVRNTTLVGFDIVANDEDVDGTIDATSVVITTGTATQRGGTVQNNGDGTVDYVPPSAGFRGTDSFQYTVNDDDGETSNVATVRINVTK